MSREAISRHCICDSHTCNFFDLIDTPFGELASKTANEQEIPPPTAILLDDDNDALFNNSFITNINLLVMFICLLIFIKFN